MAGPVQVTYNPACYQGAVPPTGPTPPPTGPGETVPVPPVIPPPGDVPLPPGEEPVVPTTTKPPLPPPVPVPEYCDVNGLR